MARALAVAAMFVQCGADQVPGLAGEGLATGPARRATRPPEAVSRSGRIATVVKAVRRRGPGRVVLGSKPQLATTEKLVSWAIRVSWAARADCGTSSDFESAVGFETPYDLLEDGQDFVGTGSEAAEVDADDPQKVRKYLSLSKERLQAMTQVLVRGE